MAVQVDANPTVHTNAQRVTGLEAILPYLAKKSDIERLKSDLTWRIVIAISVMTGIFGTIVALLALFISQTMA